MGDPEANQLYRWPAAARYGSKVPKEKFYQHGTVPTVVREKFISEVQRITWAYKLAEDTINLAGSTGVPEIQVFQIDAKGNDVSEPVLTAIDKAIPFPIVFEISRGEGAARSVRMAAAHKQLGSGAPQLSAYYSTGWQLANADRKPLPTSVALSALYIALLDPLTPVAARPGEDVAEIATRLQTARKLEREVAALERKLRTEPQLNRKIELRRTLRTKQTELDLLK
ncbi:DUF4391 domain-containing protein [Rhodococcus sp. BP-349]|uniref:DUF4391 domain-containing protein n=1 Tax=unclassified Rhodococcus (in: high G+C Gram-positive bacteria) TaxID=192944 RepID=UPI001C9A713E|nr:MULTISPECIES: DUF4391 domain-containing protein [unclassified Rhodococcus (in: high G+C Gram-positive bacteria)]MBY6540060.1 DUF4391 domain-containing protein [Rhodococcus sp. BP-363]MBY6543612.1 DUF4391 domain-containing protein [Rhodococcus sp. BP-369]MBY6562842.1 DUF4391 domain-containing protein [Rhodococcus sp. BP-370]MBY6577134.1 DUF4391 domain-containing protein [Rhodococcus sp. BP-364]MBY6586435.1 DUF4391 domain-containing protein [Rhodococcus sp. BP-358]